MNPEQRSGGCTDKGNVKNRTGVLDVVAVVWSCRRYVFARVLYTRYCAFELSTRIFAVIQRLARTIHIRNPRAAHSHRIGARSPHRQRVAIKRHEFHLKSCVAIATTTFEADRAAVSASASPSLLAPSRGTTACSAVSTAADAPASSVAGRTPAAPFWSPGHVVAFAAPATSFHEMLCVSSTASARVTRLALSATVAAAIAQASIYPRLFEAA